jgi:AcrR family transcriptional regulator
MSWHRDGRGGRRSYHHGNLREALIAAALDLIAQKGPAGFTFAEAARAAGVSPAAPYRHFRDRDALMADVARRGFERFEQRLAAAWDEGRPSPLAALERLGRAYLVFARDEPAYFSAMFEAGVPLADHPELQVAGDRGQAAAGHDDGAARLVAGARHRQPVRARRRGAAHPADDPGGVAGSSNPHLPAGSRHHRQGRVKV